MAPWRVVFSKRAESDLILLDGQMRRRIVDAIEWLSENFEDIVPIPLGGPWRGFFKLRVGDWRAVYRINFAERALIIHYIDRRDKIYKRSK